MPKFQTKDKAPRHWDGALHQTQKGGEIHGDYQGHVMKKSLYMRASKSPLLTGAAVAAGTAAAIAVLKRKK